MPNSTLAIADPLTANSAWTAGFTHDSSGNILTAVDARGVQITYEYDSLGRVLNRQYSDGTPRVDFSYDGGGLPTVPQFSKNRLTRVRSIVSESKFTAFDNLGRLVASEQRTPMGSEGVDDAQVRTNFYSYDLNGNLVKQIYPSGRVVENSIESDGDLALVRSRLPHGLYKNLATDFRYNAAGKITALRAGNGLWETAQFNNRMQVEELSLGTSESDKSLWSVAYQYGWIDSSNNFDATRNNGNVAKQTVSFNGLANPIVQSYKYDYLQRIIEAKEVAGSNTTWKVNFDYDRFGNRESYNRELNGSPVALDNHSFPDVDSQTNRFVSGQGYQYDHSGNLLGDPAGRLYVYNGDNKNVEVRDGSLTGDPTIARFYYDGEGRRVKKVSATQTTVYAYDASGKLVAEYSSNVSLTPRTSYIATDMLQSTRLVTDQSGSVVTRSDYMPFGEELLADGTARKTSDGYSPSGIHHIKQAFTGYQRDEEVPQDFAEARYYQLRHGRFVSPDPLISSGLAVNPQSFNRYTYVMNRPLRLTDPTGLQSASTDSDVVVNTSEITSTIAPFQGTNLSGGLYIGNRKVHDIKYSVNDAIRNELNAIGIEVEQLIVAQKANYALATESGATARNQVDGLSISAEEGISLSTTLTIGIEAARGFPNFGSETPQDVAAKFTDAAGQLNIPGTSSETSLMGSIGGVGVGNSSSSQFAPGDLTSAFQSASNRQKRLIDEKTSRQAAHNFASRHVNSGLSVQIINPDGSLGKTMIYKSYFELWWLYHLRVRQAMEAARFNTYQVPR